MNERENEKIVEQMRQEFEALDEEMTVDTPDLTVFRQMVSDSAVKKQKRERKELILFMVSAVLLLSVEFFAFSQSAVFFVVTQSLALISCIGGLLFWIPKEHRKVKSI